MIASRSLMIMYRLLLLLLSTLTKSAGRLDVQMKLGTVKLIDLLQRWCSVKSEVLSDYVLPLIALLTVITIGDEQ